MTEEEESKEIVADLGKDIVGPGVVGFELVERHDAKQ